MVRLLSLAACTAAAACAASSLLVVGASFVLGYGLARARSPAKLPSAEGAPDVRRASRATDSPPSPITGDRLPRFPAPCPGRRAAGGNQAPAPHPAGPR